MKLCSTCKQEKQESEFNKNKAKSDGLNTLCRECSNFRSKKYYNENKDHHIQEIGKRKQRVSLDNKQRILEVLSTGCVDCGNSDVRVLEFDHLHDKKYNVSKMHGTGYSWETIQKEINKCEVVCANCHRIRTLTRNKSYKSTRP